MKTGENQITPTYQPSTKATMICLSVVAVVTILVIAIQIGKLIHGHAPDWIDYLLDASLISNLALACFLGKRRKSS
jgi:hypothetical protein